MRILGLMVAGQIAAMLGTSALAATLPELIALWHLSAAQAGWLSGAYFAGYAVAVPVLMPLTDRVDAARIFAGGCVAGIAAGLGFATFAHGLASAMPWWTLAGVSTAGVYMPGLRVVIDRLGGAARLRAVPYYTASFGMGIGTSFFVAGVAARAYGWRAAFLAGACGCVVALACLAVAVARTHRTAPAPARAFGFASVLRNRAALRYIVAYGGHCWELFALRAWLVAALAFMWTRGGGGDPGARLTLWSSAIAFVGVPSSIAGAELALRAGRARLVIVVASASVVAALVTAWFGERAFLVGALLLVAYSALVLGDSGAITAGVVDAARPDEQGATLALHSLVGFVGGALGPIAVGYALAVAGGPNAAPAWLAAFGVMAAGSALAVATVAPSTWGKRAGAHPSSPNARTS